MQVRDEFKAPIGWNRPWHWLVDTATTHDRSLRKRICLVKRDNLDDFSATKLSSTN